MEVRFEPFCGCYSAPIFVLPEGRVNFGCVVYGGEKPYYKRDLI